tara:strand:+ start:256 stop:747 length:492 start_codon:yes stop_codon:yes gene_type:complete
MLIKLINENTLIVDDFKFKCCVGKKGIIKRKVEGDNTTPKGLFKIGKLYYRSDRVKKPHTKIKTKKIKKNSRWCNDSKSIYYNKEIISIKKIKSEKLYRNDYKYDYFLVIEYNFKKIVPNKGSAIFIHLTKNYKPTAGCIALQKKDFLILSMLINSKSKILIN